MTKQEQRELAREILRGILQRLIADGDTDGAESIAAILAQLQGENSESGEH